MIRLLLSLFLLAIAASADAATLRERLTPLLAHYPGTRAVITRAS